MGVAALPKLVQNLGLQSAFSRGRNQELQGTITQTSKLFTIPRELRDQIYAHALVSEEKIEVPVAGKLPSPSLLQVCCQITKEASPIYYGQNCFTTEVKDNMSHLLNWIQGMPRIVRCQIQTIEIRLSPSETTTSIIKSLLLDYVLRQTELAQQGQDPGLALCRQRLSTFEENVKALAIAGLQLSALRLRTDSQISDEGIPSFTTDKESMEQLASRFVDLTCLQDGLYLKGFVSGCHFACERKMPTDGKLEDGK